MKGKTVRVISGVYRGRVIPFPLRLFPDAEITSQKVKGALFSMLGETIRGKTFLDLFSGSGQIAIEATSRGAAVVANEKDQKRVKFIREIITDLNPAEPPKILTLPARKALSYLNDEGHTFDYIFLDPPYQKRNGKVDIYEELLEQIGQLKLLAPSGVIIIQHYTKNEIGESLYSFVKTDSKKYGTTSLTRYGWGTNDTVVV